MRYFQRDPNCIGGSSFATTSTEQIGPLIEGVVSTMAQLLSARWLIKNKNCYHKYEMLVENSKNLLVNGIYAENIHGAVKLNEANNLSHAKNIHQILCNKLY